MCASLLLRCVQQWCVLAHELFARGPTDFEITSSDWSVLAVYIKSANGSRATGRVPRTPCSPRYVIQQYCRPTDKHTSICQVFIYALFFFSHHLLLLLFLYTFSDALFLMSPWTVFITQHFPACDRVRGFSYAYFRPSATRQHGYVKLSSFYSTLSPVENGPFHGDGVQRRRLSKALLVISYAVCPTLAFARRDADTSPRQSNGVRAVTTTGVSFRYVSVRLLHDDVAAPNLFRVSVRARNDDGVSHLHLIYQAAAAGSCLAFSFVARTRARTPRLALRAGRKISVFPFAVRGKARENPNV